MAPRSLTARLIDSGEYGTYVVTCPQTKDDLAVDVPALQSRMQIVVRGSEDSRQHVRGGEDLRVRSALRSRYLQSQRASPTHYASVDESVLEIGIALEQLVPQKRRILKVCVQCNMDR